MITIMIKMVNILVAVTKPHPQKYISALLLQSVLLVAFGGRRPTSRESIPGNILWLELASSSLAGSVADAQSWNLGNYQLGKVRLSMFSFGSLYSHHHHYRNSDLRKCSWIVCLFFAWVALSCIGWCSSDSDWSVALDRKHCHCILLSKVAVWWYCIFPRMDQRIRVMGEFSQVTV